MNVETEQKFWMQRVQRLEKMLHDCCREMLHLRNAETNLRKRLSQATDLMVVLRCEADLEDGISKETAVAMGEWLHGE